MIERLCNHGGGEMVTEMRRVTISITEEQDDAILKLKKDDRFVRCSYSEIVRQMLDLGIRVYEKKEEA